MLIHIYIFLIELAESVSSLWCNCTVVHGIIARMNLAHLVFGKAGVGCQLSVAGRKLEGMLELTAPQLASFSPDLLIAHVCHTGE